MHKSIRCVEDHLSSVSTRTEMVVLLPRNSLSKLTRSDVAHSLDRRGCSNLVVEPPSSLVDGVRKGSRGYMLKLVGVVRE